MTNYIWLTVLSLAQAVLIALKVIERQKNNKATNNPGNDPPCKEHGERLAELRARVDLLEKAIERIERKLNHVGK